MKPHRFDIHTLAAAYALHALDPDERATFSGHLRHCDACRTEVAEFEATAARLAAATARTPPASVKRRTTAAIDGVRQLPPRLSVITAATSPAGGLRRRTAPLALAAGLAAAASFAGLAAWQYQESSDFRQQARQVQRQLDAVGTVLAAPDARTTRGRTTNGALTSVVTSERQDKAVFTAVGLPAPAPGKTYELWLDHRGTMRPAGLLHTDGTVLIDGSLTGATALGLTLEPAEGSAQPTTAPLLLMDLPV